MNGTKENTIETNTMRKSIYACLVVKVQKSTALWYSANYTRRDLKVNQNADKTRIPADKTRIWPKYPYLEPYFNKNQTRPELFSSERVWFYFRTIILPLI
ncbi:MAG: hypothetical protein A2556_03090 [Candidatus Vogelbacteria bacterium RIFOXYD2_FULL_44_9]|uniref:Uncharacterized protein n=1 Tax=Candidatus Vogelbacteria bacterium RIFOXYD2_FULL_44_9 TaxID=1802441 RepID=A0A1G2QQ61_9BACT|nr:MAG: hypothetical protein A2556_03090 [Candidatus Vogelbacteria bacterium RIFOXYD2_FULL_44_9]